MDLYDTGEIAWNWVKRTFGENIAKNDQERCLRLLEETLELYQALGGDRMTVEDLAREVFKRPTGDPHREIGQVGMVLAALAYQIGPHMYNYKIGLEGAIRDELMRVLNIDPKKPQARMHEKWANGVSHIKQSDMFWLE